CCVWLLSKEVRPNLRAEQSRSDTPFQPLLADAALRSFLDVKAIQGEYEAPEGDTFAEMALMRFEDGKFIDQETLSFPINRVPNSRVGSYCLLWGRPTEQWRGILAVRTSNATLASSCGGGNSGFLSRLDGQYSSGPSGVVRGYRSLGVMTSTQQRNG